MARNIDRKQLKNPDQFVSFWTRLAGLISANRRAVIGISVATVLAIAVVWGGTAFFDGRAARASEALSRIERIATAPLLPAAGEAAKPPMAPPPPASDVPQFKTEKERLEAALKDAEAYVASHGNSRLGDEALLIKARLLLSLDKPAEAIALYERLMGGGLDPRYRFLAHEGLAYAHEASGQLDKAIATFGKLADDAQAAGGFYRDRALFNKARLLETKGNPKEAEKLLREILEKSPTTTLRDEINDRLAAFESKAK